MKKIMIDWLKKNGAKILLGVLKVFVKDHTVVGKLVKIIDMAEKK